MMADEPEHLTGTEARGGASTHMTRYILPISLGAIVAIFAVILIIWL